MGEGGILYCLEFWFLGFRVGVLLCLGHLHARVLPRFAGCSVQGLGFRVLFCLGDL